MSQPKRTNWWVSQKEITGSAMVLAASSSGGIFLSALVLV